MRRAALALVLVLVMLTGSVAWAQLVVNDPAVTLRNAVTAALKESLLQHPTRTATAAAPHGAAAERPHAARQVRAARRAALADPRLRESRPAGDRP